MQRVLKMGRGVSKLLYSGRNPLQSVAQKTLLEFEQSNSYFLAFTVKCCPSVLTVKKLDWIDQDASRVAKVLYQNGVVHEEKCRFFPQEGVCTFENIETQFIDHASSVKDKGIFVFFFSGHGIPYGKQFVGLAPEDYNGTVEKCITSDDLISWLRRSNCRANNVLFIIDACFSGGFTVRSPPSNSTVSEFSSELNLPKTYIMYSSEQKETSSTSRILQSSLFSYCLSHAIDAIAPFPNGLPIKRISDVCGDLTHALFLLRKTTDEDVEEQHPGIKLFQFKPTQEKNICNISEGNHLQLVPQCLDWIKKCQDKKGPLDQLKESGDLEKQWVIDILLCFMLRYIACIHLFQEYVTQSAFFNIAYEAVVDTLRKYSEKKFENRERQLGLNEYRNCLRQFDVPLTDELSKLEI